MFTLFRYDHHQKTFAENASTVSPGKKWTTKLSSAGLVYLHYGRDIICGVLGQEREKPSEDLVEKVFDKVYANFVEEIDANDNGIDTHDGEPRYQVRVSTSEISFWRPRFTKSFFPLNLSGNDHPQQSRQLPPPGVERAGAGL